MKTEHARLVAGRFQDPDLGDGNVDFGFQDFAGRVSGESSHLPSISLGA